MSEAVTRVKRCAVEYQRYCDGWTDERTGEVLTSLSVLGRDAATAEAEYRRIQAVRSLRAIADRASAAGAKMEADADDEVADVCLRYKLAAANLSTREKKLTQLRAASEDARAILTYETTGDRIHARVGV